MRPNNSPLAARLIGLTSSFCIVGLFLTGLFLALSPVDVLKDWAIMVPEKSYEAGTSIILESRYTKVRDVSGQAFRYLECRQRGVWARYPLEPAQANRNAAKQRQATGIVLQLPNDLPNLPLTCRIGISVDYQIYSFRKFNEYNVSNTFELTPKQ